MMKKSTFIFACLILCSLSLKSEGQFLKKLGDKIEKSVDRRLERKTDQAIEKSLDKVESETENTLKEVVTSSDEKEMAETKQQASWPVANSSGNTTTKKPQSENYTLSLTGSGPDLYLEYRMEMVTGQTSEMDMNMVMRMYASPSKGGGRSEVSMQIPMIGEMKMVTLVNFKDPTHLILLNERKKRYSVMDLGQTKEADVEEQFTVTKLGEEKLHGLHSIHARAVSEDGQEFEIWTSREIPGYEDMLELYSKNQRMGSDNLWKELEKAGCAGFMVKLKVETGEGSSIMELTKVEKTDVPKSMLLVPPGYKESNGAWTKRFLQK